MPHIFYSNHVLWSRIKLNYCIYNVDIAASVKRFFTFLKNLYFQVLEPINRLILQQDKLAFDGKNYRYLI